MKRTKYLFLAVLAVFIVSMFGLCTISLGANSTHTHSYKTSKTEYVDKTATTHKVKTTKKCSCGKTTTSTGRAENHTWSAGKCSKCGYVCKHSWTTQSITYE